MKKTNSSRIPVVNVVKPISDSILTVNDVFYLFPIINDRKVKVDKEIKKYSHINAENIVDPGAPIVLDGLTQERDRIASIVKRMSAFVTAKKEDLP